MAMISHHPARPIMAGGAIIAMSVMSATDPPIPVPGVMSSMKIAMRKIAMSTPRTGMEVMNRTNPSDQLSLARARVVAPMNAWSC